MSIFYLINLFNFMLGCGLPTHIKAIFDLILFDITSHHIIASNGEKSLNPLHPRNNFKIQNCNDMVPDALTLDASILGMTSCGTNIRTGRQTDGQMLTRLTLYRLPLSTQTAVTTLLVLSK